MNDIQIIGLDIANTKDCSVATSICGNCKSVISMNTVNAEENYNESCEKPTPLGVGWIALKYKKCVCIYCKHTQIMI